MNTQSMSMSSLKYLVLIFFIKFGSLCAQTLEYSDLEYSNIKGKILSESDSPVALTIRNCKDFRFEKSLFDSLEVLTELSLIDCNIEVIPDWLQHFQITKLDLSHNKITRLNTSVISNSCNLLILDYNPISVIIGDSNKLQMEYFSCTDGDLNGIDLLQSLSVFQNLISINVSGNSIGNEMFDNALRFAKLEMLDLSRNELIRLTDSIFYIFPNLSTLYAYNNKIAYIQFDSHLTRPIFLRQLYVHNNPNCEVVIKTNFTNLAFVQLPELRILELEGLSSLKKMYLITTPRKSFNGKGIPKLEQLHIDCFDTYMDLGSLVGLEVLTISRLDTKKRRHFYRTIKSLPKLRHQLNLEVPDDFNDIKIRRLFLRKGMNVSVLHGNGR